MSEAALSWLAARRPEPPDGLREALEPELTALPADQPLATSLAAAAVRVLRQAIELGDERAAAWRLLVADALLTYAMEAAAEQGPDALESVVESCGPAALARSLMGEAA